MTYLNEPHAGLRSQGRDRFEGGRQLAWEDKDETWEHKDGSDRFEGGRQLAWEARFGCVECLGREGAGGALVENM